MNTMTLHGLPELTDPEDLPAYIEAARAEFENQLRNLLDATPGGYAADLCVHTTIFQHRGTDTRALAKSAIRSGAKVWRASKKLYGAEFGGANSGTSFHIDHKPSVDLELRRDRISDARLDDAADAWMEAAYEGEYGDD